MLLRKSHGKRNDLSSFSENVWALLGCLELQPPSSHQSGDGGNTNDSSLIEITGSLDDNVESLNEPTLKSAHRAKLKECIYLLLKTFWWSFLLLAA